MFQMDLPYRSPMENDWLWDSPCYLVAAVCSLQAGNPVIVLRIPSFDSDSTRYCPWFDRIGGSTRHVRSSFTFVIAADSVLILQLYVQHPCTKCSERQCASAGVSQSDRNRLSIRELARLPEWRP